MDFLYQGIPLGRFMGTRITLSITHLVMLVYMASGVQEFGPVGMVAFGLVYFVSILLHEFGHVLACKAVGGHAEQIVLGPMGGLVGEVQPPHRPLPQFITTAGGPAVNAILLGLFWGLLQVPAVVEFIQGTSALAVIGWVFIRGMVLINKLLLVFNLLPIYPMDGGRLLQYILWPMVGYRNSMLVTGMLGTVGGAALLVLGLGAWQIQIPYVEVTFGEGGNDYWLLIIGLTSIMASWQLYSYAQHMETWRKN